MLLSSRELTRAPNACNGSSAAIAAGPEAQLRLITHSVLFTCTSIRGVGMSLVRRGNIKAKISQQRLCQKNLYKIRTKTFSNVFKKFQNYFKNLKIFYKITENFYEI